ncbi:PstS family phosphate ABC transporter substrate-binding protein [Amycolatopsis sp. H20-H5]|uniref:PstS family phosphate ABC transporter substrate-binding protein n=1 Tax=Amycolatopsis sp. H20-H5 TaxID=3046309 RepID=UPI002DBFAB4F|nr:substrate-binding domain-containing protein [Amycolatopsis sp. H20-H5]MEC3973775.1 substrate-binding domain-containing protein [Amycolatopsis sp. H20-H5]
MLSGFADALKTVGTVLSGSGGTIGLAVGIMLVFGAPLADRYLLRPKRLQYRVLYDSNIGLSPDEFYDNRRRGHADPQLVLMGDLMSRMTVVVIRIRNIGSKTIDEKDFGSAITLSFSGRVIHDIRISEAGRDEYHGVVRVDSVRDRVRQSLDFVDSTGTAAPDRDHLEPGRAGDRTTPPSIASLREVARKNMQHRFAGPDRTPDTADPPGTEWKPDQLVLSGFRLDKRERFKLLVVLLEPETDQGVQLTSELTKGVLVNGQIDKRQPRNQKKSRRVTWQQVATATGTLLTGVLVAALLIPGPAAQGSTDASIRCARGTVAIKGSSAFTPIIDTIAGVYRRSCAGATITVTSTGSINGVHEFTTEQGRDSHNVLGVLSDGKPSENVPDLEAHAIAVIVYSMVVNRDTGIDGLTLEQVRGIYTGQYRDWQQLRSGPSLPIRIVSRGQESGTRATFERKVLGHPETILSSDSCLSPERAIQAPVIRCERSSAAQQLDQIAATPGAIGYSDTPAVKADIARGSRISSVPLDGRYPDVSTISAGFPFWTVEYLYTQGVPDNDSVLKNLLDYLSNGNARAELHDAGYTPCVTKTGLVLPLCGNGP